MRKVVRTVCFVCGRRAVWMLVVPDGENRWLCVTHLIQARRAGYGDTKLAADIGRIQKP